MSIVNSCPLTVDNLSDPSSPEPLTPNHLLTLKSLKPCHPLANLSGKMCMPARDGDMSSTWLNNSGYNGIRSMCLTSQRGSAGLHIEGTSKLEISSWRRQWICPGMSGTWQGLLRQDRLVRKVKIQFGDRNLGKYGKRLHKPSVEERPVQKLVLLMEAP